MLNDDYKDILSILLRNKVKFLVVGAYAMGVHGYPRSTGDVDVWVEVSSKNAPKIITSLVEFGAPVKQISEDFFLKQGGVYQIGIAPRRIDILTMIDGVDFKDAFPLRDVIEVDGLRIPFLSMRDLIKNKKATNRPKDRLDVDYIKSINKKNAK